MVDFSLLIGITYLVPGSVDRALADVGPLAGLLGAHEEASSFLPAFAQPGPLAKGSAVAPANRRSIGLAEFALANHYAAVADPMLAWGQRLHRAIGQKDGHIGERNCKKLVILPIFELGDRLFWHVFLYHDRIDDVQRIMFTPLAMFLCFGIPGTPSAVSRPWLAPELDRSVDDKVDIS